MSGSESTGRKRSLLVAAVALLIAGVLAVVWAVQRPTGNAPPSAGPEATSSALPAPVGVSSAATASPSPVPSSDPGASTAKSPVARPRSSSPAAAPVTASPPAGLAASAPRTLKIPELGIDASLITLGLNADHSVQVPPSPDQVGWFTGSPTPGQLGPSVILGHVSWLGTPAAFYKIGTLKRGQTLSISRADGMVLTFTVQGVREYPKDRFPTNEVYGNLDYPGLRLITCSGDYDANRHYFPDNLVVYAQLTGVHQA